MMKRYVLYSLHFLVLSIQGSAQSGNVGINTSGPQARIHVVRNATSGGPLLPNALALFEDNQSSFIHLSHPNNAESGIFSGNQSTLIRSGLLFGLDSSMHFRAGGNFTRMIIKEGNVGINTLNPLARLHVQDSSVLFTGPLVLPGPSNPPVSGPGTRMMWYADKAALRAGNVSGIGTHWDRDSIGINSAALGSNTKAKGNQSMAFGNATSATGQSSTAMGQGTIASGLRSFASGFATNASGQSSTAMGFGCIASGLASTAIGSDNTASGVSAIALGTQTTASGENAFAAGKNTDASGLRAVAMGFQTNASGINSLALGAGSIASGSSAFAMGFSSHAAGEVSTSMGVGTKAKSYTSLVVGHYNDTTSTSVSNWILTDPLFIIGNGVDANNRSNAVTVLKNGKTGIGTFSPQRLLHVSEGAGGSIYNSNAEVIIEDNAATYLQFSCPTTDESGILSGNEVASLRSALIFRADSSVQIRAGGSTTRLAVTKNGNTGIGTLTPDAKLEVNGNVILGTNGTAITEIIKVTVVSDIINVLANNSVLETFPVPNCSTTSTVWISPGTALAPGLVLAYARVSVAGTVEARFTNTTGADINPPAMNFFITVIR